MERASCMIFFCGVESALVGEVLLQLGKNAHGVLVTISHFDAGHGNDTNKVTSNVTK